MISSLSAAAAAASPRLLLFLLDYIQNIKSEQLS